MVKNPRPYLAFVAVCAAVFAASLSNGQTPAAGAGLTLLKPCFGHAPVKMGCRVRG